MKELIIKEKIMSFLDSYDVYDKNGDVIYRIKGSISLGHCFKVYNKHDEEVAILKEELLKLLPSFKIIVNDECIGHIKKELTFLRPKFNIEFKGWKVRGNIWEWDYSIYDERNTIAEISKKIISFTDTYTIKVFNDEDELNVLLIVAAIDAIKCSQSGN